MRIAPSESAQRLARLTIGTGATVTGGSGGSGGSRAGSGGVGRVNGKGGGGIAEQGRSVADLGEWGVIAAIAGRMPVGSLTSVGIGDDAAVVGAPSGSVVAAVDLLLEGRHFRLDWSSAYDIGVKAAARSLADIAAMGAVNTALLVAVAAPGTLPATLAGRAGRRARGRGQPGRRRHRRRRYRPRGFGGAVGDRARRPGRAAAGAPLRRQAR